MLGLWFPDNITLGALYIQGTWRAPCLNPRDRQRSIALECRTYLSHSKVTCIKPHGPGDDSMAMFYP